MKNFAENFKNIGFAIVLLFSFSNTFANEIKPVVKILNAENKVFALVVDDTQSAEIRFKISDSKGIILLQEEATITDKVNKSYNLSNLPSGIYEIEIEDKISFRKQIVKISLDKFEILEKEERRIYKPRVKKEGDYISLNALTLNKNGVQFSLLDSTGEVIFSDQIENAQAIHKNYNIEELSSGYYSARVEIGDKVFYTDLSIK